MERSYASGIKIIIFWHRTAHYAMVYSTPHTISIYERACSIYLGFMHAYMFLFLVFERMHACVEACGRSAGGAPCTPIPWTVHDCFLRAASRGVWLRSGENSSASISSCFLASVM
jgi:hypothetical protein